MVDVQEEAGVPVAQRKTMKLVKINDAGVAVGCSGYQRAGEGCEDTVVYDGVTRTLTTLPDLGFGAGAAGVSPTGARSSAASSAPTASAARRCGTTAS